MDAPTDFGVLCVQQLMLNTDRDNLLLVDRLLMSSGSHVDRM
jgi:hypothetical protein